DATAIRRVWSELLSVVRKNSRSTEAMLTNATVHSVDGDTVTISHTAAPLAKRLGEARNVDAIAVALRDVLGGNWQVKTVHAAAESVGPPPAATPPAPRPAPARPEPSPVRQEPPPRPVAMAAAEPLPPEPDEPDEPDGPDDFGEPKPVAVRHDPAADMVRLLTDKLGARPLD
ncbi:MAG: DNA polymerase III subunit gamma/tau, partial [Labedaea sp.]